MDDVARRREARRRKILENSKDRLQKITGVEEKSTRDPVFENHNENTNDCPSNSYVSNESERNEVETPRNKTKVEKQPPKQYRKTVISALGVFIYVLLLVVDLLKLEMSSSHINKIFLPLLVYEVIEFFSSERQLESKSFIFLLLAANARNKHVLSVIKYLELFSYVFQDVMLYFFVFVCCGFIKHLVWVS